jgi:hypothetical protein
MLRNRRWWISGRPCQQCRWSFSQRLKVLAFLDHSLDQACDSEGGMFWSAFSVAVL